MQTLLTKNAQQSFSHLRKEGQSAQEKQEQTLSMTKSPHPKNCEFFSIVIVRACHPSLPKYFHIKEEKGHSTEGSWANTLDQKSPTQVPYHVYKGRFINDVIIFAGYRVLGCLIYR